MSKTYDVIVIGAHGAMGSAVSCQLKMLDKSLRILGIDQYPGPHPFGSSHGESRIIRKAICEGEECVDLVLDSYNFWENLQQEIGDVLLVKSGGLLIGSTNPGLLHGSSDFVRDTIAVARKRNISHEILTPNLIRAHFPQFNIRGDEYAYYEPEAGYVRPEVCISAQIQKAREHNVNFCIDRVIEWKSVHGEISVKTAKTIYYCDRLIISPGPWIDCVLPHSYSRFFKVYRQVMYWFGVAHKISEYSTPRFPVFIWGRPNELVYGFPALNGKTGGLKVATEQYLCETRPQSINRNVDSLEIERMQKIIQPRLLGLTADCKRAVACMYTCTPDSKFVIDYYPGNQKVVVISSCSGHGFKHSAGIGKAVSELVVHGKSKVNLSPFSFLRFSPA